MLHQSSVFLCATHSETLNCPVKEHQLTEMCLFCAQVNEAFLERISLSATGFSRYGRNQA